MTLIPNDNVVSAFWPKTAIESFNIIPEYFPVEAPSSANELESATNQEIPWYVGYDHEKIKQLLATHIDGVTTSKHSSNAPNCSIIIT
jgi:hypothetical protein